MIFGIEFLSLLVFMVYIGAIAVLFLFVIMMLNIKIVEISTTYFRYLPVSFFIIIFFLFELIISVYLKFGWFNNIYYDNYLD
jgi:NADH:ubiquinone oxidoreductase subunit 6 (subunit J)